MNLQSGLEKGIQINNFDEFYKADGIENKWDLNVQINAMRYLNMLLDEGIVDLCR